jgi:hypothetical protein
MSPDASPTSIHHDGPEKSGRGLTRSSFLELVTPASPTRARLCTSHRKYIRTERDLCAVCLYQVRQSHKESAAFKDSNDDDQQQQQHPHICTVKLTTKRMSGLRRGCLEGTTGNTLIMTCTSMTTSRHVPKPEYQN